MSAENDFHRKQTLKHISAFILWSLTGSTQPLAIKVPAARAPVAPTWLPLIPAPLLAGLSPPALLLPSPATSPLS